MTKIQLTIGLRMKSEVYLLNIIIKLVRIDFYFGQIILIQKQQLKYWIKVKRIQNNSLYFR